MHLCALNFSHEKELKILDASLKYALKLTSAIKTYLENNKTELALGFSSSCKDCVDICAFTVSLIDRGLYIKTNLIAI